MILGIMEVITAITDGTVLTTATTSTTDGMTNIIITMDMDQATSPQIRETSRTGIMEREQTQTEAM